MEVGGIGVVPGRGGGASSSSFSVANMSLTVVVFGCFCSGVLLGDFGSDCLFGVVFLGPAYICTYTCILEHEKIKINVL